MFDPSNPDQVLSSTAADGSKQYVLPLPNLVYRTESGAERPAYAELAFVAGEGIFAIAVQTMDRRLRAIVVLPTDQWEAVRDAIDERIAFVRAQTS